MTVPTAPQPPLSPPGCPVAASSAPEAPQGGRGRVRPTKLHLGCGTKHLDGWLNVDGQAAPVIEGKISAPPDMVLNIQSGLWQLEDEAYEHIYSSHVIEHLYPSLLPEVLRHLLRLLVPGGVLTIATTDLMGIVEHRYLERDDHEFWEAALFGGCDVHDHPMAAHRNCFDYEKLVDLLGDAGFAKVRPWEPEQYPEIFALDDYSRSARLVSVLIEGIKGAS